MGFIVAVDGPAGSGKGSITQIVAERLNLVTIDTGAMYRSVTLAMLEQNVGIDDLDKIVEILKNITPIYGIECKDDSILELMKYRNKIILMLL